MARKPGWRRSLKGTKGFRGLKQRKMKQWLREFYEKHKDNPRAYFTLDELLEDCDMNRENTKDYTCAMAFLKNQRAKTDKAADAFFGSPEYQEYLQQGLPDRQMFDQMMKAALSYEIYPVRSEAAFAPGATEGYRLMNLDDFAALKQRRTESMAKEFKKFVPTLLKLVQKYPELGTAYQPPALPKLNGAVRLTCEECGATFTSQKHLVDHYSKKHVDEGCDEEEKGA